MIKIKFNEYVVTVDDGGNLSVGDRNGGAAPDPEFAGELEKAFGTALFLARDWGAGGPTSGGPQASLAREMTKLLGGEVIEVIEAPVRRLAPGEVVLLGGLSGK